MAKVIVNTTLVVVAAREEDGTPIPGKTKEIPPGVYEQKTFPVSGAEFDALKKDGHVGLQDDKAKDA